MNDAAKPSLSTASRGPSLRPRKTATMVIALLAVAVVAGAGLWWLQTRAFETTDDAFITGRVTSVSSQVAGRVLEVLVADNQRIAAGDLLVRLDPATFQVKRDQALANLHESGQKLQEARSQHLAALAAAEQAKADASSAQAQATNASTDLTRYNKLVESGAVSQQAKDNADTLSRTTSSALQAAHKRIAAAEAQAALAGTQIQTAEAVVEKNQAALEQAKLDLAYSEIKVLVGGRVTKKSVEPGDYVQVGQSMMNLVQDELWVVANFKETQLQGMRPGQPVDITVDAYPGHRFTGHVDSLQAGTGAAFSLLPAQNATGNYVKVVQRVPVKIVFDLLPAESGMHLAPGMSVVPRVRVR